MLAPCQLATRQLSPACLIVLAPPPGLRGGPSACMLDRWRGESPCMMGTRAFFVAVDRPIERNQPSERERSPRKFGCWSLRARCATGSAEFFASSAIAHPCVSYCRYIRVEALTLLIRLTWLNLGQAWQAENMLLPQHPHIPWQNSPTTAISQTGSTLQRFVQWWTQYHVKR